MMDRYSKSKSEFEVGICYSTRQLLQLKQKKVMTFTAQPYRIQQYNPMYIALCIYAMENHSYNYVLVAY